MTRNIRAVGVDRTGCIFGAKKRDTKLLFGAKSDFCVDRTDSERIWSGGVSWLLGNMASSCKGQFFDHYSMSKSYRTIIKLNVALFLEKVQVSHTKTTEKTLFSTD